VKKLARIAGISKNFEVIESENIVPSYKNELEHIVRIKIKCLSKIADAGGQCMHDVEDFTIATGEANRTNTSWRGKERLRMMAEKRGYDIAVLEHIGIHSMALSEEESETFAQDYDPNTHIYDTDIEATSKEVNAINAALDEEMLDKAAKKIKTKATKGEFTERQLEFLRGIHAKRLAALRKTF
jgi:hypothetical protein